MKTISNLAFASLLITNGLAFAATPAEGWYAGITGGGSMLSSLSLPPLSPLEVNNLNRLALEEYSGLQRRIALSPFPITNLSFPSLLHPSSLGGTIKHSLGGDIAGQVGYRICNFRFEGELLFNYAPFSKLNLNGFNITKNFGKVNYFKFNGRTLLGAGLINAYYDFYDEEDDPTWVPYLGLGVGYSHITNTTRLSVGAPFVPCLNPFVPNACLDQLNTSITMSTSTNALVGQGIIGVSYYTSDNVAVGLDYRYLSTTASNKELGNHRLSLNSINLNINYWFTDS
ncbi:MAG: outer membrane beta-barrel protein [Tatlockia sp.]|nr:outer membrane beta-barrel protein [Tatlockia sp.]